MDTEFEAEAERLENALVVMKTLRGEVYANIDRLAELSKAASAITSEVGIMLAVLQRAVDKAITSEGCGNG